MPTIAPIELTLPELQALTTLAVQRIAGLPMGELSERDEEALIDFTRKAAVIIGGSLPGGGFLVEATEESVTITPVATETE